MRWLPLAILALVLAAPARAVELDALERGVIEQKDIDLAIENLGGWRVRRWWTAYRVLRLAGVKALPQIKDAAANHGNPMARERAERLVAQAAIDPTLDASIGAADKLRQLRCKIEVVADLGVIGVKGPITIAGVLQQNDFSNFIADLTVTAPGATPAKVRVAVSGTTAWFEAPADNLVVKVTTEEFGTLLEFFEFNILSDLADLRDIFDFTTAREGNENGEAVTFVDGYLNEGLAMSFQRERMDGVLSPLSVIEKEHLRSVLTLFREMTVCRLALGREDKHPRGFGILSDSGREMCKFRISAIEPNRAPEAGLFPYHPPPTFRVIGLQELMRPREHAPQF